MAGPLEKYLQFFVAFLSTAEASPAIEEDWFEREEDDIIADVEKIKVRGTRQLETEGRHKRK